MIDALSVVVSVKKVITRFKATGQTAFNSLRSELASYKLDDSLSGRGK